MSRRKNTIDFKSIFSKPLFSFVSSIKFSFFFRFSNSIIFLDLNFLGMDVETGEEDFLQQIF